MIESSQVIKWNKDERFLLQNKQPNSYKSIGKPYTGIFGKGSWLLQKLEEPIGSPGEVSRGSYGPLEQEKISI
jgi:hypothetical protein